MQKKTLTFYLVFDFLNFKTKNNSKVKVKLYSIVSYKCFKTTTLKPKSLTKSISVVFDKSITTKKKRAKTSITSKR